MLFEKNSSTYRTCVALASKKSASQLAADKSYALRRMKANRHKLHTGQISWKLYSEEHARLTTLIDVFTDVDALINS